MENKTSNLQSCTFYHSQYCVQCDVQQEAADSPFSPEGPTLPASPLGPARPGSPCAAARPDSPRRPCQAQQEDTHSAQ